MYSELFCFVLFAFQYSNRGHNRPGLSSIGPFSSQFHIIVDSNCFPASLWFREAIWSPQEAPPLMPKSNSMRLFKREDREENAKKEKNYRVKATPGGGGGM